MTNKMNATFYHILCFKHLGSNVNSMDILIKRKSETVRLMLKLMSIQIDTKESRLI